MSELYNAIVALTVADSDALIAYRDNNNGQLPPGLPATEWVANVWRNPDGYVSYDVQSAQLADLDTLLEVCPDSRVYGAWHRETGEVARSLRDDCIDLMPNVVTFNDAGEESSRTRPSTCHDVHLWAGQHERGWSADDAQQIDN